MKTLKVGVLYLSAEHFVDEANKTVGRVATSTSVLSNRRSVTARVNEDGEKIKSKVIKFFADKGIHVKLRWSRYCGCKMCPCSPGFDVVAFFPFDMETLHYPLNDSERFRFDGEQGTLKVRKPMNEGGFKGVLRIVKEIPNSFNYIMEA
jgi:hypothetical protein